MGLTGAGGALVAIPLFMQFLGMSLKEASVYSLFAVIIASLINFLAQRKSTQYRTAIIIVSLSALGSYFTAPYKESLPTMAVAILLAMVSLYALYNVWVPVKTVAGGQPRENFSFSVGIGLLLGALTTFTGLGGGVLMLPLFLSLYRYSQAQAVATSLLAVGLSSLASLAVQVIRGTHFEANVGLVFMLLGIMISVLFLKETIQRLPSTVVTRLRQMVFTVVVVLALIKIL
jgi:uncharacterized protein